MGGGEVCALRNSKGDGKEESSCQRDDGAEDGAAPTVGFRLKCKR